ncbi:glycosyltransferase family 2 protein [Zobellia galactanivorans]|uniref:glycosyltransferase family 2 protein n=1 Tax=Zobellia galactanivorans (strain DSM 12802 / CCUG 47099 / CIP 106680 / NCIMB 13871 / Dsij) TaxID=63186 RepID=UPI0026E2554F|nr:glycosyltransferase family 2 protein [Zobellia galactanivorans]MDO6810415.1 glycosyltransferase family 2 protein [Zobellia galactanivorans]
MHSISTFILTYNEEKHIERCIKNAQRFSETVYIVDSFSSDKTVELAESLGAKVYQNKWENNHAKQVNWALENLPIQTEWVFRLDADEYLTDELILEIGEKLPTLELHVSGVVFERKMYFLNKLMTKGMIQMNILRMFRYGKAVCEDRWMDEHIVLTEGDSIQFDGFFVDHNLNPLGWWIEKHNNYAIREAVELLNLEFGLIEPKGETAKYAMSADAQSKRDKKKKYANMPLFWRSFIYFVYRYFFKFGFTQGKEGFLWHFLQGWWYRTLVDAKVYEIKKACGNDTNGMKLFIYQNYGIRL